VPYITATGDLNESILPSGNPVNNPAVNSLRGVNFTKSNKGGEIYTQIYQKGCNIKKYGRLRGNMQYVEDSWDVQIQPISFKYAYLKNDSVEVAASNTESKIRDKYIKIRVKYDGTEYAIINALKTLFTISYA